MRAVMLTIAVMSLGSSAAAAQAIQSPRFEPAMRANATLQLAAQRSSAPFAMNAQPLAVQRDFNSRQPGATMMIIGGAALLAGLLTNGSASTMLIVGGIGVGAYGFYLYNR